MDKSSKFGKLERYNFAHCLSWCLKEMKQPADKKRTGTWAATGDYIWRGYSDGNHPEGEEWEVIRANRDWDKVTGSNELYAFRATCVYKPELVGQFVSCYCTQVTGVPCTHTHITNAHMRRPSGETTTPPKRFIIHQKAIPAGKEVADDSGDDDK